MTRNLKTPLLCILCIFLSGLLVSYKSFEIFQKSEVESFQAANLEASAWAADSVEQKLSQLESSVSYLDKSTVETLKRLGARYFAYAYQKKEGWGVKWKVLSNTFGKDQILSEVNEIDFDKISEDKRIWSFTKNNKMMYVAPVGLADSHQLTSGFLIFGIDKSFFSFLNGVNEHLALVDENLKPIHNKTTSLEIENKNLFTLSETKNSSSLLISDSEGRSVALSSFFSPTSQLWVINKKIYAQESFVGSSYFAYALLGGLLGALLFLVLMSQLMSSQRQKSVGGLKTQERVKLKMPEFIGKAFAWFKPSESVASDELLGIGEVQKQVVGDFSDFMDEVLSDEFERLSKVNVSLKTQIEEDTRLICSKQHVRDFIKRLVGNSVLALEKAELKEIQIQLVEQSDSYQLIYVDTREEFFPTGHEPSLFLQTEGSIVGIDGIISYASWLFGEGLTVAKKGFCLSVDLEKFDQEKVDQAAKLEVEAAVITPFVDTVERIEISDEDTSHEMLGEFKPVGDLSLALDDDPEVARVKDNIEELQQEVSLDDLVENFELKEFEFEESEVQEPLADTIVETDDKGLFELNNGSFKLKIRSPKKRDADVDR